MWAEDFGACPDLPQPLKMKAHEPYCSSCRDKNEDNRLSQAYLGTDSGSEPAVTVT